MSDCCLPNLGCLSIPIKSTEITGPPGQNGTNGRGVSGTFYNAFDGTLTIFYTDGTSQNVGVVQGPIGGDGPPGVPGVARLYSSQDNLFSNTVGAGNWFTFPQATITINPNTLVNNGDSLTINLAILKRSSNNVGNRLSDRRIKFNASFCAAACVMTSSSLINSYTTKCEIIKTSSSSARCITTDQYELANTSAALTGYQEITRMIDLGGINFTASNTITIELQQELPVQLQIISITIDKTTVI